MGMLNEFKKFAIRGNVIDLAVGVVIGGAFGAIVTSLVDDIMMPMVNPLMPDGGWQTLMLGSLKIGNFISAIVKFLITAFGLFMLVKGINSMKKNEAAAPEPKTPEDIVLLREIRDALKK